jgi:NTE family protein
MADAATTRTISLALQGGGAHGAFTWGVLDRLLEEDGLAIDGISGTSAGAMNACALAWGLMSGGREGARAELDALWRGIARLGDEAFNPYRSTPLHALFQAWNLDRSPVAFWLDVWGLLWSPYQLNPTNRNPLGDLLRERIPFDELRRGADGVRLFVCATNIETNRMRIFERHEMSAEALLASGCLPQFHQAVGVPAADGTVGWYWDGGYIGNPVLKPLIRRCSARDILLVQINPIEERGVPRTVEAIQDRLNEVTANAALMRELDVIATVNRMIQRGVLTDPRYDQIRFHKVHASDVMGPLGLRSKWNTALPFLLYLRDVGRARADAWLRENRGRIGREGTLDLEEFAV